MSKRTEQIPIPGKLDEVIDESLEILKQEKRKQRARIFAGIAAGLFLCVGCFGAAVGNFRPGSGETEQNEGTNRGSQGTLVTVPQDAETDRLLVKDDPAAGNLPSRENFVYMQESGGITVTAANVYHNGYTLYMTVTVRGEEPLADRLGCESTGGLCRIRIESEGAVDLSETQDKEDADTNGSAESAGDEAGGSDEIDSVKPAASESIEGNFLDDRTFLGTVRVALSSVDTSDGGRIEDDFYYDWSISAFCGEDGEDGPIYEGDWKFRVTVPADMRNTEVTEINGTNESGEGIERIVKTAEDISAQVILPSGASEEDYVTVMCDASGALLNRSGDYCRTENRDISTVYIFLCGRADYEKLAEEYESVDRKNGAPAWIQSLRKCARYSVEAHFESKYLSVVQAG